MATCPSAAQVLLHRATIGRHVPRHPALRGGTSYRGPGPDQQHWCHQVRDYTSTHTGGPSRDFGIGNRPESGSFSFCGRQHDAGTTNSASQGHGSARGMPQTGIQLLPRARRPGGTATPPVTGAPNHPAHRRDVQAFRGHSQCRTALMQTGIQLLPPARRRGGYSYCTCCQAANTVQCTGANGRTGPTDTQETEGGGERL